MNFQESTTILNAHTKKSGNLSYAQHIYIYIHMVMSWDTAGTLWANGNDSSASKSCPNTESSSDEGFVRSNAVV